MPTSHAHRGSGIEAALRLTHELYWNRERVLVRHYGISGRWFGSGSRFVPFPKAEQPPDFDGCVAGRKVVFDAKEHRATTPTWSLDKRYAHQLIRLQDWAAAGALAFFAVEVPGRSILFLVRIHPDSAWPKVAFDAVDKHVLAVPMTWDGGYSGLYDWLSAVREAGWL